MYDEKLITLPRITLMERQLFDLEMLLNGGFRPLRGFMNQQEYDSVVDTMHMPDGSVWPIPVIFDVKNENVAQALPKEVILTDIFGNPIAFFKIQDIYVPDKLREARLVYQTTDRTHPGVRYLLEQTGDVYIGGDVELIAFPTHHDFSDLRYTPEELKQWFAQEGWKKVVAFQTRNPIHRAHYALVENIASDLDANILIHPVVGLTKEGDIDYITRVRSYRKLVQHYLGNNAKLALLPLAMRMAGPREALWHALIRSNYGATHFIVGRDHAGPGSDASGKPFYGAYDAHALIETVAQEIPIQVVTSKKVSYVEELKRHIPQEEILPHHTIRDISGTDFRNMLRANEDIPEWFSFPEVIEELRRGAQQQLNRGYVLFFTGLSGAGKSTIAHIVYHKLLELQDRRITYLDGDVVRTHLSRGLGFSQDDRNANIERIGFVAGEIAKHGGIAICSAIAPYAMSRERNRDLISRFGTYVEVFVDTPIDICAKRDVKGLYKKARAGELKNFTGVDDPYERPQNPELTLYTDSDSPEASAERVLAYLKEHALI